MGKIQGGRKMKKKTHERLTNYLLLRFVVFGLLIAPLCCVKNAHAEESQPTWSISGKVGAFTPYVSEYTGEYIASGLVYQPSATLTHNPSGLYVSTLGYITRRGVDEVDLFLGKSTELWGMTLDTGIGFYNAENMGNMNGDFFAAYVGVDFPEVIGIIPFAYIEADIPLRKEFGGGGWLWKVGVKKTILIFEQSINFKMEAGGNDGIYGSEAKLISFVRGTASLETKLLGMKVIPSFALQRGFGGIAGDDWRGIAGLSFPF